MVISRYMRTVIIALILGALSSISHAGYVDLPIWMRWQTAAGWTSNNPILGPGEIAFESDNAPSSPVKWKVGDGVTAWNSLPYQPTSLACSDLTGATAAGCAMLEAANVAAQRTLLNVEESPGTCEASGGESLLAAI